jgi:CO/xanthine dehydrogenase FAD-binding subunit
VEVCRPQSLVEALAALGRCAGSRVIAGGTDLVPQLCGLSEQVPVLVDISDLAELKFVHVEDGQVVVGAAVSHAELTGHPLVRTFAPLLARACAQVGSPQVRNRGTIGGNLGTASPAGDSLPVLVALGAELRLRDAGGTRDLPVGQFLVGPKRTTLRAAELIIEVRIPCRRFGETGFFYKVGARRSGSIALASAAGWMRLTSAGSFESIAVALGSVGPTVVMAQGLSSLLEGARPTDQELWGAVQTINDEVQPIDDIRASADYRRGVVVDLVYAGITTSRERMMAKHPFVAPHTSLT